MKRMTQSNSDDLQTQSYKDSLQDLYKTLENSAASNSLDELDGLLDRCMLLESPERERLFVDEVCKMGGRRHLAA